MSWPGPSIQDRPIHTRKHESGLRKSLWPGVFCWRALFIQVCEIGSACFRCTDEAVHLECQEMSGRLPSLGFGKNQHTRLSADFRTSSSHSVSYLLETSTEFLQIFQRDDVFELSAGVSFCPPVSIHWLMWLTSACLIFVSQHPHGSRTNPVGYGISFEHSDHQSTKKTADGCVGSVTRCATSLLAVTLSPNATDVSRVSGMM